MALADLLGERDWQLDVPDGIATFGTDLRYRVQLLGTESHLDGTWLWAWANEASNIPPSVLHLAGWLREYGHRQGSPNSPNPRSRSSAPTDTASPCWRPA
ncbi:hypothetical protein V2I01_18075 [Micromonospora sp. BRA006-A]|nr:hypothetical protein [Micromonospora sp. BRA006-A]